MIDMTGEVYGKLTVIRQEGRKWDRPGWLCRCECGNEKIFIRKHLTSGLRKSCGCDKITKAPPGPQVDMIGKRFGMLTVTGFHQRAGAGVFIWTCICDCGRVVNRSGRLLRKGQAASCGGHREPHNKKHYGPQYLYSVWRFIKRRCCDPGNPSYRNYGGRGIVLFDAWMNDSTAFSDWILQNLGDRPSMLFSLDRIDNDAGYVPGNLRWADRHTQGLNKRRPVKNADYDELAAKYEQLLELFSRKEVYIYV